MVVRYAVARDVVSMVADWWISASHVLDEGANPPRVGPFLSLSGGTLSVVRD